MYRPKFSDVRSSFVSGAFLRIADEEYPCYYIFHSEVRVISLRHGLKICISLVANISLEALASESTANQIAASVQLPGCRFISSLAPLGSGETPKGGDDADESCVRGIERI